MNRFSFTWKDRLCIGCGACRMACKEAHGLGIGESQRTVGLREEIGFYSESCRHCAHPACAAACLTGAMHTGGDGVVRVREELCHGCGRCVAACPYGHPFLRSGSGTASKCDGCSERRELGLDPICVSACPTRALGYTMKEE